MNEKEKRRYADMGEEKRRAINERRRRAHLVKKKREAEKKRTLEKWKALGPLTLTIPLTDCLKSVPVTAYVKAFCASLESADTNVSPTEWVVLPDCRKESKTVTDPPDWDQWLDNLLEDLDIRSDDDLSSLLEDISPDLMSDVEDFDLEADHLSSLLEDISPDLMSDVEDLEALVPPEDLVHVEDMPSDEGIDLMYDLVT